MRARRTAHQIRRSAEELGGASTRCARGSALAGRFDLIVANPPYVAITDEVDDEVVAWEPADALFGGADGLDHVREIIAAAPTWLTSDGVLVVEIGATQGEATRSLAADAGFRDVVVIDDLSGRPRILRARR